MAEDSNHGATCDPITKEVLFLPLFDAEREGHLAVRGIVYALAMVYFFLGVSIVADTFVASIEVITTRKKKIRRRDQQTFTVSRWNDTVANLSLMALGSSAPEICLSCVELFTRDMYVGQLGPATIVGSAAFNLLVIVGVCVMAIPAGEVRIVLELPAFYVTAAFSVFAYVWLMFILVYSSPNVVDIWEAAVTLCCFPMLVWVSYKMDVMHIGNESLFNALLKSIVGETVAAHCTVRKNVPAVPATQEVPIDAELISSSGSKPGRRSKRNSKGLAYIDQASLAALCAAPTTTDLKGADSSIAGDAELLQPSLISFHAQEIRVERRCQAIDIQVDVLRTGSCDGVCDVSFETQRLFAVPGYDYIESEGRLEFGTGEFKKTIGLEVLPCYGTRTACDFILVVKPCEDSKVRFNPDTDGGEDCAICTVVLEATGGGILHAVDAVVNINNLRLSTSDWFEQFWDVWYCGGTAAEHTEASCIDKCFHILCLPWKLIFLLVPPASYGSGWACFIGCLAAIFAISALLADFAELFGCVVGVPDIVTAVSFVALGTSMPDLFASLSAAQADPSADASVVNVTGSNSVNVFLGLGLPWTLAAIYWRVTGRTPDWEARYPSIAATIGAENVAFVVPSNDLGFSVLMFSVCCVCGLVMLVLRRRIIGGELGGPFWPKVSTLLCFVALWLGYTVVVCWKVSRCGTGSTSWCRAPLQEQAFVLGGAAIVLSAFVSWALFVLYLHHRGGSWGEANEAKAQSETCAEPMEGDLKLAATDAPEFDDSLDKRLACEPEVILDVDEILPDGYCVGTKHEDQPLQDAMFSDVGDECLPRDSPPPTVFVDGLSVPDDVRSRCVLPSIVIVGASKSRQAVASVEAKHV